MNRATFFSLVSAMLILAGCDNNTAPAPSPPPTVNSPPPRRVDVQVQTPGGVDVKVDKGKVQVNAPGTDVEVDRKN